MVDFSQGRFGLRASPSEVKVVELVVGQWGGSRCRTQTQQLVDQLDQLHI